MATGEIKYIPKVGDPIQGDEWKVSSWAPLLEDKITPGFSDKSFPGCQFRYNPQAPNDSELEIAIDIKVTGKPHYYPDGIFFDRKSRIQIKVIGDGEASKSFNGWILHKFSTA